MGVGDVYTIASSIDGNWLAWSITYYFWSFIGVCFAAGAIGFVIGLAVQYGILNKRLKESAVKDEELKKAKYEVSNKQTEFDLLKQKYDTEQKRNETEITKLKSEIDSLKAEGETKLEETHKLTKEELTEYVSKFPDAQKDILAEIYEAGGSIEAEALDSNLIALASAGLIEVPPVMVPGTNCTWSLTPEINDLITRHPEVVESKRAKEHKEREEEMVELTDYLKHLDHESKMVLWVVYSNSDGSKFEEYSEKYDGSFIYDINRILTEFKNLNLVDYEYIDINKRKWSITQKGKDLVGENKDLFKYAIKNLNEAKKEH